MINETALRKVKELLATPQKIVLIPHRNPDGDAIGSALGLYHVLNKTGHQATVITPNDLPDFLNWMPAIDQIVNYEKNKNKAERLIEQSDVIFTLDFNVLSRAGDAFGNFLSQQNKSFVMIDHHQFPGDYAEIVFSDTNYGSTCELLYTILMQLNLDAAIDKDVASCLYTGIVTDSGSFKFPKTTAQTHRSVANLIDKGIDNPEIHNLLFNNSSYNRLQLMGCALQNMVLIPEKNTSYLYLSDQELLEYNHKKGDTEGFVNYGLSIEGIELTAFFIERKEEGIVKISFRSQGNFDVNQFARTHFEGGGHINAAGGKSFLSLEETIEKFVKIVKSEKQ